MSYLVDTNVISEVRKGPRCHAAVAAWWSSVPDEDLYLSVLTIGEIRKGIESIRRREPTAAVVLEKWLRAVVSEHEHRILPIDLAIVDEWARLNVPDPLPVIDSLMAATAKVRGLTLVTRNIVDIARTGIATLNPWQN